MENNQIDQAPYMSVHEQEDMNYFESELKRLETTIEVPMRTRRLETHHSDPMDELVEVYEEVKEMEENLAKAINIANFIISKNKDMFAANVELQEELETVDLERQTIEEQNIIYSEEIKQLGTQVRNVQLQNDILEEKVREQETMLEQKDEAMEKLSQSVNETNQATKIQMMKNSSSDHGVSKEEHATVLRLSIEREKEIQKLTKNNQRLEELFKEEQTRYERTHEELIKVQADLERVKSQTKQLQQNLKYVQAENEELNDKCEVLEEEYEKMVNAQNNAEFAAGQMEMQGLRSSFGNGDTKQRQKKTSFASNHSGNGGLGDELENLNYKPLADDYEETNDDMDYHEIQIEDMGSLRGSP